jgi:hypothetical protein
MIRATIAAVLAMAVATGCGSDGQKCQPPIPTHDGGLTCGAGYVLMMYRAPQVPQCVPADAGSEAEASAD